MTEPISVAIEPQRVVAREGESVTVECLVKSESSSSASLASLASSSSSSNLLHHVEWLKDGRPLSLAANRIKLINRARLRIASLQRQDKGNEQRDQKGSC